MQSDQQLSQGFESNKTIIEEGAPNLDIYSYRPVDYCPRVLQRSFIFKKLPQEINDFFESLPSPPIIPPRKGKEERLPACSPYQAYEGSQEFQLVYNKNEGSPLFRDKTENYTSHQISLKHLSRYQQQNFYQLKHYQPLPRSPPHPHLQFDSRFECGNLLCAFRSLSSPNQYHLFLENDTNRNGYNQWFFFSLKGIDPTIKYSFRIVNFRKQCSFFKAGMRPVVFSLGKHKRTGNGWERRGENVRYGPSMVYDRLKNGTSKLYCLDFEMQFAEEDDFVTISLGLPYSYSRLIRQLRELKSLGESNDLEWSQRTIAYSLSNNQVPYLVIKRAQPIDRTRHKTKRKRPQPQRPIILLLARQHPGQTHSSFLMESFLRQLALQTKQQTKYLLSHYQFHIFPMINVDGVIYGNFRCDLAGFDLNRVWRAPVKELHPQVWAIMERLRDLQDEQRIVCCYDFHSHSKEYNVFSYCCKQDEVESRILPFLMSKINSTFHFPSNTFGLTRDKFTTARGAISSLVKHPNVLTIQCSAFATKNQQQTQYLDPCHFQDLARAILQALKHYLQDGYLKRICEQEIKARLAEFQDYERQNEEENAGSDSEGEVDSKELLQSLKIFLPEGTVKRYEAKCEEVQAEKSIFVKETQRKQPIAVDNKTTNLQRYEKPQIKEKPRQYHRIDSRKQQILAIMRTKETPKQVESPVIRMPLSSAKPDLPKHENTKTEGIKEIKEREVCIIEDEHSLIAKPRSIRKNRSSLLYSAAIKDGKQSKDSKESKAVRPKPDLSRFKLRSFQEETHNLQKVSSVGDKRNPDLRRMSKIQKILRIRKRANTLKNIIHQQSKSQFNNQIFEIKIGQVQASTRMERLLHPKEQRKLRLNKSSTVINKQARGKKDSKVSMLSAPSSLIGQLWKINYSRYSKQLS